VFKDYNLSQHYKMKHAEICKNLTDAARTLEYLLAKLQKQQDFFTKLYTPRDVGARLAL